MTSLKCMSDFRNDFQKKILGFFESPTKCFLCCESNSVLIVNFRVFPDYLSFICPKTPLL